MSTTAIDCNQLNDVKPGDQIIVRFKKDAISGLVHVANMVRSEMLELVSLDDKMNIATARENGEWQSDTSRSVSFAAGSFWSRPSFERHMLPIIEHLSIFPQSSAQAAMARTRDHLVAQGQPAPDGW